MDVKDLSQVWDAYGRSDPLWAILTWEGKRGGRWNTEEFFETGREEIGELMRYVESLGAPLSRRGALDFGCGVGRLTQALADHFEEVHGVDAAPSMIELAKRYNRWPDKCSYHLIDQASLEEFGDATFDFIYSVITLQHIDAKDSQKYIREFVRILAPGGVVVFQLPSVPKRPARQFVRHLLATTLIRVSCALGSIKRPVMLMYGMKREAVMRLLEASGAQVLDVQDGSAGGWFGYRYCALKPSQAKPMAKSSMATSSSGGASEAGGA